MFIPSLLLKQLYTFGSLAEIVAGTVLAGELSLAAAISSTDWVSSHGDVGAIGR